MSDEIGIERAGAGDPRHQRIKALFARAAELPAEERAALLDAECGGDAALRRELESLMGHAEAMTKAGFRDPMPRQAPATQPDPLPGTTIAGKYRILSKIGEGGFGAVYEAEQTAPVHRRVAFKVLKPGMDSKAVLARFEAERQALAVMEHAGIAKVHDAGETDRGLPFFVMELVNGDPITSFCDGNRLSIDQRIELLIEVCHAVQHAHAKGVVHRDLKPSNILVGYDGEGHARAKVIDFGVAKALNQRLSERTIFTDRGQMIGTPEYMSPEQAEMSGTDIDTRADVYSLGVVLYELLTGMRPFDLRQAAFVEIQRVIREVEPPRPSTRLSTLLAEDVAGTRITEARRTDARSLSSALRRDLDWVVMKSLEKDRERRYDTANALAAELGRYLEGEPVEAGPPSATYRLRKFVRRNKGPIAAIVLLAASLLIGTTASTVFALRERAAKNAEATRAIEATRSQGVANTTVRILNSISDLELSWVFTTRPVPTGLGSSDTQQMLRRCADAGGELAVGNMDAAEAMLREVIADAKSMRNVERSGDSLTVATETVVYIAEDILADIYAAKHDYETAYRYAYSSMRNLVMVKSASDDPAISERVFRLRHTIKMMGDERKFRAICELGLMYTDPPFHLRLPNEEFLGFDRPGNIITRSKAGRIIQTDPETKDSVALADIPDRDLSLSPDARFIAVADVDGTIRILRFPSLRPAGPDIATDPMNSALYQWISTSRSFAVLESVPYETAKRERSPLTRVRLWDIDAEGTLTPKRTFTVPHYASFFRNEYRKSDWSKNRLAFMAYFFSQDNRMVEYPLLLDTEIDGDPVAATDACGTFSIALDDEARYLLTTCNPHDELSSSAKLFDAASGDVIAEYAGHDNWVVSGTFSPDGEYAVTGAGDGTIRFWCIAEAKQAHVQHTYHESSPYVYAVAFSNDGSYFAAQVRGDTLVWRFGDILDSIKRGLSFRRSGARLEDTPIAATQDQER